MLELLAVENTPLLWGFGLLAAALLLVVIELFVPSGGVIAITSGVSAIAGVVFLFKAGPTWGLIGILVVLILGPTALGFGLKIWPHTPIGRRMLGAKTPEEIEREHVETLREREKLAALVGQEGVVLTDLRPVGVVEIGGRRHDALSESSLVRAGSRVRVTAAEPNQVRVRAV